MSSNILPDRVYLTQVAARWNISAKEVLGLLLDRNIVFVMLEDVERAIFFPEEINEIIKEIANKQGKEIPNTPSVEHQAFLRVPVLDEYLESILKKGYWEGIALVHGFERMEESKIFKSAVVSNVDKSNNIRISLKDLYVHKQDLLSIEEDLGVLPENKNTNNENLHPRTETTYLNIIGALLEIILGESPNIKAHPSFSSQAQLINHLSEYEVDGLSKSNLEKKFAEAKRFFSAF